ncbi:MAG: hypothetical protein JXA50_11400, partial [Deltaproteobacteria bacterium]|nr:hypothetical protein [Deltaproteobacteria bacterium]
SAGAHCSLRLQALRPLRLSRRRSAPYVRLIKTMKVLLKIVLIGIVYGLLGYFLYRGRVLTENKLLESDFIVFFAPAILATFANMFALWSILSDKINIIVRFVLLFVLSLGLTVLFAMVYSTVAFSYYGT